MCLGGSTSINNDTKLAITSHYDIGDMKEELVKELSFPGKTRGTDIYNAVTETVCHKT